MQWDDENTDNPRIATNVTQSAQITALFIINKYEVTFNDEDATIFPVNGQDTQRVEHGSGAIAPPDPVKIGYTFSGWHLPFDAITTDMTITAQWLINSYTISFDTDGGSDISDIGADFATPLTAPADPTKSGYQFAGWYRDPGLTLEYQFPETMPAENLFLYAKWNAITQEQHTVTFESNGGTAIAPQTVVSGSKMSAPSNPSRKNYSFKGWYRDSNLSIPWNFATDLVDQSLTLYAKRESSGG